MESLPLMLQVALLLLGVALTRYLWEINITVASVVLDVTSFGAVFYLLIVIAGTASESCPYQTPGSDFLRHILHHLHRHLLPAVQSAPSAISHLVSSMLSSLSKASICIGWLIAWWRRPERSMCSTTNVLHTLFYAICIIIIGIPGDVLRICWTIPKHLVFYVRACYRHFGRTMDRPCTDISPHTRNADRKAVTLDLRCTSWILQTSLDKTIHVLTLERLVSTSELSWFHPTLVLDCFNVFIGCINIGDGKVMVMQGLERLATVSAACFFSTLLNLTITNPTSNVLADLHRRYIAVFSPEVDFTGLQFHSTMTAIDALANRFGNPRFSWWHGRTVPDGGSVPFSRRVAEVARVKYQRSQRTKVPRWILRPALHFLSLGSVFPPLAVADYLTVIALDLGCDVPDTTSLDEKYVYI